MKQLLILITTLFSLQANATVLGPDTVNTNTNAPVASAVAAPVQGQQQGQVQLQGQSTIVGVGVNNRIDNDVRTNAAAYAGSASQSKATSNSGGNTQAVTVTDSGQMHYSGGYEVKNVPNVSMGNVYPTSPCMGGTSVGASGVGFGLSFGSSWTDDECGIRETARSFNGLGLNKDAVKVLCTSKYAAAAPICKE